MTLPCTRRAIALLAASLCLAAAAPVLVDQTIQVVPPTDPSCASPGCTCETTGETTYDAVVGEGGQFTVQRAGETGTLLLSGYNEPSAPNPSTLPVWLGQKGFSTTAATHYVRTGKWFRPSPGDSVEVTFTMINGDLSCTASATINVVAPEGSSPAPPPPPPPVLSNYPSVISYPEVYPVDDGCPPDEAYPNNGICICEVPTGPPLVQGERALRVVVGNAVQLRVIVHAEGFEAVYFNGDFPGAGGTGQPSWFSATPGSQQGITFDIDAVGPSPGTQLRAWVALRPEDHGGEFNCMVIFSFQFVEAAVLSPAPVPSPPVSPPPSPPAVPSPSTDCEALGLPENVGVGNDGCGNVGNYNVGNFNVGSNNVGNRNVGSNNRGDCNQGSNNVGNGWTGSNLGPGNGPNWPKCKLDD